MDRGNANGYGRISYFQSLSPPPNPSPIEGEGIIGFSDGQWMGLLGQFLRNVYDKPDFSQQPNGMVRKVDIFVNSYLALAPLPFWRMKGGEFRRLRIGFYLGYEGRMGSCSIQRT
jgi:hypothetical protein